MSISVVIPAYNEAKTLLDIVQRLKRIPEVMEVIVVDDGSSDGTGAIAKEAGAKVIRHPIRLGNGAAVKAGARAALGEYILFMDGDGQHDPDEVEKLVKKLGEGYVMVVGARLRKGQAGFFRRAANFGYNKLASYMVGHPIADLTSGMRIVNAKAFRKFLYLLPNGFSYPTTITMAFFRAGLPVAYIPVAVHQRDGKSRLKPLRDGPRFLLIIFRIATLYSPLKVFVPLATGSFLLGVGYYLYTFLENSRFTNMSALLLSTAMLIFLIGLVSEQITALMYKEDE